MVFPLCAAQSCCRLLEIWHSFGEYPSQQYLSIYFPGIICFQLALSSQRTFKPGQNTLLQIRGCHPWYGLKDAAPEQIQMIEYEQETVGTSSRADSFCIGLVLLSALLLKDCYYLYNRTIFSLNREKLLSYQQELKALSAGRCPNILKQMVLSLLELSPSARYPPSTFLLPLLAQQRQILRMQGYYGQTSTQGSPQVFNYIEKPTRFLSVTQKDYPRYCGSGKRDQEAEAIGLLGRRLFEE